MNIGLLAAVDSRRRGPVWSATSYYMAQALERHCGDVVHLAPLGSTGPRFARLANRVARDVIRRRCDFNNTWLQAREWARLFSRRLDGVEVLLATSQTALFALLETDIPIVYTSDATFDLVRDYYQFYTGLPRWNVRAAERIEGIGLRRAALAAYPSQWAAASARHHYGVPDERIRVVAYGANFDDVPSRSEATSQRSRDVCHLLFVATDWDRKGGDVAYQAMRALRDGGVDAELTVVGSNPPRSTSDPHLRVYGRLDKQVDADRRRLSQLYLKSHFLLVPTRADCFGMVFAEASAHGTPSIAADTGGVSGAVASGENGFLLPPGSEPAAYAALIANLFTDHARYQALVRSSRTMFEEHLNWDVWGRRMSEYIAALSPQRTGSSLTSVPRVDAMTASPIA